MKQYRIDLRSRFYDALIKLEPGNTIKQNTFSGKRRFQAFDIFGQFTENNNHKQLASDTGKDTVSFYSGMVIRGFLLNCSSRRHDVF